ncbi:hypothetical protein [Undibacterium sp. TS12]|uniref:hypothetical protein n=1 Tax=Undibacterium sp. TS12 TaxID=2908202 RepID=UPI001F4CA28A|nr:hypothetical protein [Undibacterium sp. TS12]MCH8621093.1 hypothetical protein [Undibacterium sp. TS12]
MKPANQLRSLIRMIAAALLASTSLCACLSTHATFVPVTDRGIAGAGQDSDAVRDEAWAYPEFKEKHVQTEISKQSAIQQRTDRNNYFADFEDHVHVRRNTPTRLGSFEFNFVRSGTDNGLLVQVHHDGMRIMLERIPSAFYMGELQATQVQIGGRDYLLLAANSRTSTQRMWFGIFRPDGSKLYAASLEQSVVRVHQNVDGISLFFLSGDSMRIKI